MDILETLWDFANLCTLILDHGNLGEQVSALSQVDPLTNMYSYKYWHEELNREIAKTDKVDMDLSLMDIKLNKFKEYNSMNGHVKGDDLLVRVSKIVSDKLCELDIPCRVGPNWHVILVGENQEAAAAIAQEILTDVEKLAAGENTKVTMSIGLSTYNKGEKERDLLRRVENAMQEARRQGGYRVNVQ